MKVLIVGYGFVGSAVGSIFTEKEQIVVDPKINDNKISDYKFKFFDAVFVAVDTPKDDNFGLLDSVLAELNEYMVPGTPVCCKSTATPEFYASVDERYKNLRLLHSPEYLNKSNPIQMFQEQKFFIIGGEKDAAQRVASIFRERLKHVEDFYLTDLKTASLVKYAENFFLSMRVTYFNEMFLAHKQQGCESTYDEFVQMLGMDKRIGHSHNKVPGADGKYGWSSHCLDKDGYMLEQFTQCKLVKFIRELNQEHRNRD